VLRQRRQQVLETASKDDVVLAQFDNEAKEKAGTVVNTFR
jgi:hypothetical protein